MKACSFHQASAEVGSVEELLARYLAEDAGFDQRAVAPGCGRHARKQAALPFGIRIHRSYSSNNSGDSVVVGRFERVGDVRALHDALAVPDPLSAVLSWAEIFTQEGIEPGRDDPNGLEWIGRALLATAYHSEDALPGLRELVWKRGGTAVFAGASERGPIQLLVGLAARDVDRLDRLRDAVEPQADEIVRRGDALFATLGRDSSATRPPWPEQVRATKELAARLDAVASGELVSNERGDRLVHAAQRRLTESESAQLFVWFPEKVDAEAFVASLADDGETSRVTRAGHAVLVDCPRPRPRLGRHAQALRGRAVLLPGGEVRVRAMFSFRDRAPEPTRISAVERALDASGAHRSRYGLVSHYGTIEVATSTVDPHEAMVELTRASAVLGVEGFVIVEAAVPLTHALSRIESDLVHLRSAPRPPPA
jgi:hypothetical protein